MFDDSNEEIARDMSKDWLRWSNSQVEVVEEAGRLEAVDLLEKVFITAGGKGTYWGRKIIGRRWWRSTTCSSVRAIVLE